MRMPGIIFENDEVLVINKPPGLVVNRAESVRDKTIQDWIEEELSFELAKDIENRNGIVHRLDKDTSGVMVVAKNLQTMRNLQRQFKERTTQKTYLALVHGKVVVDEGSMSLPLGRGRKDRKKQIVKIGGKKSKTAWKIVKRYNFDNEWYTYLELEPKTGRTHQLRVHLKHMGHPIVGDKDYLSRKRLRKDAVVCPRQFLHAWRLCFFINDKKRCFEAELAGDLKAVLKLIMGR